MKHTDIMNKKTTLARPCMGVALVSLPGLAWSHPGHGLDGLWAHDVLHGATAVLAVALVTLLAVGFIRHRRQKQRR